MYNLVDKQHQNLKLKLPKIVLEGRGSSSSIKYATV